MIKLRDFCAEDLDELLEQANNPNVARYLASIFPSPYTRRDGEFWLSQGCKSGIHKAIEHEGRLVGAVGVTPRTSERVFSAAIGYWLGEDYWGKGIASAALQEMMDEIFNATEIIRLFAAVYHPNIASMRVLEKCGYQREGILRKSLYKNGEFYDEHLYAKLKP